MKQLGTELLIVDFDGLEELLSAELMANLCYTISAPADIEVREDAILRERDRLSGA